MARLGRALDRNPQAHAILLFDLAAALHEGALFETLAAHHERLLLLPIFRSPRFPRYFHVKARRPAKRGSSCSPRATSSATSARRCSISAYLRTRRRPRAFAGLLARVGQDACSDAAYLACTLRGRFADGDERADAIAAAFHDSCGALASSSEVQALASLPPDESPFFTAAEVDAAAVLHGMAHDARRQLRGATHQLGDRVLWSALDEAAARGVDARLWLGSPGLPEWREPGDATPAWLRHVPAGQGWEAHAKLLLADDETLLWGSGNFTSNGLGRSTEVFFARASRASSRPRAAIWRRSAGSWPRPRRPRAPAPRGQRRRRERGGLGAPGPDGGARAHVAPSALGGPPRRAVASRLLDSAAADEPLFSRTATGRRLPAPPASRGPTTASARRARSRSVPEQLRGDDDAHVATARLANRIAGSGCGVLPRRWP